MSETLRVVLEAVAQPFQRDMKAGEDAVKNFSKNSRTELAQFKNFMAGAFTVGAVGKFTNDMIRMGSQIFHNAQAVGLSTDAFQALEVQTNEAGGSTEALRNALGRLQQQQDAAIEGNAKAVESFARLGISVDDVAALDIEGLYLRIAQGVGNAEDKTAAYSAVAEIFGRRVGPQLWEALNNLATLDWTEYQNGLKQSGQIMDEEITQKLAEAEDTIKRFQRSLTIIAANTISAGSDFFSPIGQRVGAYRQVFAERGVRDALFSRDAYEDLNRYTMERANERRDSILARRERIGQEFESEDLSRQARMRRLEENRAASAGNVVAGNDPAAQEALEIQRRQEARLAEMVRLQQQMIDGARNTFTLAEF